MLLPFVVDLYMSFGAHCFHLTNLMAHLISCALFDLCENRRQIHRIDDFVNLKNKGDFELNECSQIIFVYKLLTYCNK